MSPARFCWLLILFTATLGCAEAEKLMEEAKKSAQEATASPAPAPAPATTETTSGTTPPAPSISAPTPAATATEAQSDAAILAKWEALPTNARGDGALLALAAMSPQGRAAITEITVYGVDRSLTAVGLAKLTEFPALQTLDVSQHALDAPQMAALGNLSGLESLTMNNCYLNDDLLGPLQKLTSLKALSLEQNSGVTDLGLAAIHELGNLEKLGLANCQVQGQGLLKAKYLPTLKYFSGARTPLADIAFTALQTTKSLEYLDLTDTKSHDKRMKLLSNHKNLRHIRIGGNPEISDIGFVAFQGNPLVEVIDIHDTKISGKSLAFLKKAKHLKQLATRGSQVDDATKAALKKALPECDIQ